MKKIVAAIILAGVVSSAHATVYTNSKLKGCGIGAGIGLIVGIIANVGVSTTNHSADDVVPKTDPSTGGYLILSCTGLGAFIGGYIGREVDIASFNAQRIDVINKMIEDCNQNNPKQLEALLKELKAVPYITTPNFVLKIQSEQ